MTNQAETVTIHNGSSPIDENLPPMSPVRSESVQSNKFIVATETTLRSVDMSHDEAFQRNKDYHQVVRLLVKRFRSRNIVM